jgi:hypothetical protein
MKRIALIALAGIALFATAAAAHQNGWGNNHMRNNVSAQQNEYSNGNCPMGGNMMGHNMMRGNQVMINGVPQPTGQSVNSNWKTNPSYQGQTTVSEKTGK